MHVVTYKSFQYLMHVISNISAHNKPYKAYVCMAVHGFPLCINACMCARDCLSVFTVWEWSVAAVSQAYPRARCVTWSSSLPLQLCCCVAAVQFPPWQLSEGSRLFKIPLLLLYQAAYACQEKQMNLFTERSFWKHSSCTQIHIPQRLNITVRHTVYLMDEAGFLKSLPASQVHHLFLKALSRDLPRKQCSFQGTCS